MTSLRVDDPAVIAALDTLLAALEEFRVAYAAWAGAAEENVAEARALLAVAERKVEAARAALDALDERLSNP